MSSFFRCISVLEERPQARLLRPGADRRQRHGALEQPHGAPVVASLPQHERQRLPRPRRLGRERAARARPAPRPGRGRPRPRRGSAPAQPACRRRRACARAAARSPGSRASRRARRGSGARPPARRAPGSRGPRGTAARSRGRRGTPGVRRPRSRRIGATPRGCSRRRDTGGRSRSPGGEPRSPRRGRLAARGRARGSCEPGPSPGRARSPSRARPLRARVAPLSARRLRMEVGAAERRIELDGAPEVRHGERGSPRWSARKPWPAKPGAKLLEARETRSRSRAARVASPDPSSSSRGC